MNSVSKMFTTAIISGLMMGVAHAEDAATTTPADASKTKSADEAQKCCGQMKGKAFDECKAKMGKAKGMGKGACSPGACGANTCAGGMKGQPKAKEKKEEKK